MKTKRKLSILQLSRLLLQIVLFVFLPALYISTLDGVKQIYLAFIHRSISANVIPQLIEVIAIIPITILLGRFFCGWMCAFGSFSDFIYRISQRVFKKKFKLSEQADAWMKIIKYIVLAILVVDVWTLEITAFRTASPWDVFGMLVTVGKVPDFPYVLTNLTVGFAAFIAIIVASALIERFFCRYLCPLGAIFSLVSKLRVAKIKKPSNQCGACRMCTNSCAMGIPLYKMDVVSSGECINCMKCITSCPRGNADFAIAKKDIRPLMAGVATVATMTGIYYTGDFTVNAAEITTGNTTTVSQTSPSATENQLYKDGTYQGSGTGFRGATTTVSVVVLDGKIDTINLDSSGDDRKFLNRAYSTVSQEIISSQSTDVDAVSGATFSSNGIMRAVADALSNAAV
ncbi:4Fe-4S binding protein [Caproiciproducens faecalis]|uniref:4Fe-4S binding protein n=1 Tax=Caproiciproducens faecalis TaxID=2820301 RepID=A0ABS7DPI5_9FIRM|nr:4Fe-4S binding protein [Caproiciproducens faecalis]MBW7573217.1 4Fe-4S binding protein [Caproiciproducens faecalis]